MSFFSTNYDLVIVGGGISGLFLAYKLSETNLKILLLEKEKNLGGRIHTIKKENYSYECGAARFNENHFKLISLINELDLQDQMIQLPKDIDTKVRKYDTINKLDTYFLLNILGTKYSSYKDEYLKNITFYQLIVEVLIMKQLNLLKFWL